MRGELIMDRLFFRHTLVNKVLGAGEKNFMWNIESDSLQKCSIF